MLENPMFTDQDRDYSRETLETECNNLLLQIERLQKALKLQQRRLTNVMGLVSSSTLPSVLIYGTDSFRCLAA